MSIFEPRHKRREPLGVQNVSANVDVKTYVTGENAFFPRQRIHPSFGFGTARASLMAGSEVAQFLNLEKAS